MASWTWKPRSRSPATCTSTIWPTTRRGPARLSRTSGSASPPASTSPASAPASCRHAMEAGSASRIRPTVWYPGETVIFGIGQGYLRDTHAACAHGIHLLARQVLSAATGQGLPRTVTGKIEPVEPKLLEPSTLPARELEGHGGRHEPGDERRNRLPPASAAQNTRSPARPAPRRFHVTQNQRYGMSKWTSACATTLVHRLCTGGSSADRRGRAGGERRLGAAAAPIARRMIDLPVAAPQAGDSAARDDAPTAHRRAPDARRETNRRRCTNPSKSARAASAPSPPPARILGALKLDGPLLVDSGWSRSTDW